MSLPEFSVKQVVLSNLIFALLLIGGVQVARTIPVDLFPDVSFNTALIVTPWPGASPQEVERLVTQKIEEEIDGTAGVKEMISTSSSGHSEILVEFEESLSELEYESALNDLRASLDRVDDLPEEAETPILRELSVSERFNVCMVAVADAGGVGEFTLREVAHDVQERLERFPGLRNATLRGERDRELRVLVDENRAARYDLTLAEIHRVIAQNNQNFSGGSFTDPGRQEVRVRGLGNFVSPEELADTVVKKNPDGSHVRLSDVAQVEAGFEKRRMLSRQNGRPTIVVGVSKDPDQDIIDLVDRVHGFVDAYAAPPGVDVAVSWDSATYVANRIEMMRNNLLFGIVLVVFVLWLTVGFRNALLAIIAVPFSFLTAIILFPLFDVTINSLSLVGFVMVSGMLVDDAIILLENIYRHIEEGHELRDAVVKGAEEVMWPVTAAIATTIAAFIPMLLVTGTSGEFMEILPKTVILCLLGSLFEALVILPAHYLDWGSRRRAGDGAVAASSSAVSAASYRVRARMDGVLDALRDRALHVQRRLLENRGAFLTLGVAALWFSCGLSQYIPVNLFPSDFNQVMATVEATTDFGLDETDALVGAMESALEPMSHELLDVTSYVGFSLNADQVPVVSTNVGVLFISFPTTRENVANPTRVLDLVKERVGTALEGVPGVVGWRVQPPRNGPPIGKPVAIRIMGDDYDLSKQIAEAMKGELTTLPGVYNVEDNLPVGPRELRVRLDEHRASIHGLTFADVGFALRAVNDGVVPSTFKDPRSDEDVDIRVLLREEQRRTMADLLDAEIRTPEGYRVKLGDVARVEVERGYQSLYHYDARRTVVVYADVDNDLATSLSVNEHMQARFADVPQRYPGTELVFGGEFQGTADAFADMRRAFGLAVIAIFGILAAQFRSYTQPFIVMSVIAFSFIGVVVGMFVMNLLVGGYSLSMYVLYALVGLAGIVVNDSLVLIDFVNRARARGMPAWDAVRDASRKRFRPILLTTVTTILGLLPMAVGASGYSPVFAPFAASIVFGLLAASVLTFFAVPTLYLTLDDLTERLRPGRRPALEAAPEPLTAARGRG